MAVDQNTVAAAGMDPFATRLAVLDRQRDGYEAQDAALGEQKAALGAEGERLIQARGEALKPIRERRIAQAATVPAAETQEEAIPKYERPTMKPQELNEAFGMMVAASMLVGAGSRTPFYGVMNAMTGAMNGFVKQDQAVVEESLKIFDKDMATIKERNGQLRRRTEDAYKTWERDFAAGKREYELIAAEYDDPIALNLAREGRIDAARKQLESRLRSIDGATSKLETTRAQIQSRESIADQASADRRFIAGQASADRRAATAAKSSGGADASGIDPKTVDFYAAQSISGDNNWQVGLARGKVGQALIAAVKDRIPAMAAEMGLSPQDVGTNKAANAGLTKAITERQKFLGAAGQFVRNFESQIDLVEKYTEKGASNLNQALNKWVQNGRVALQNDPSDVVKLDVAIRGAAREHQRIVTGVTSNAQLHVAAQETADQLLNRAQTPAAIKASLEVMREEAKNAIKSGEQELEGLKGQMRNIGRRRDDPSAPTAAAPSTAPTPKPAATAAPPVNAKGWKLHTDSKGNRAYVSPDGKSFEEVR